MRLIKAFAILFVGTVIAETLFVIPTRDLVAILIAVMAVTMRFSRREETDFRVIFYVSAISAVGFLYFGQPATSTSVVAGKPVAVHESEPSVSTHFLDDGGVTVEFSGDYMRPKVEERKSLRQESPEEWMNQLRRRFEMYPRDENMTD